MGKIQIDHTGSGGGITLSSDGTSLLVGGTAVGGADLFAENPSSPTAPSATGSNSVAIGSESESTGTRSISIGTGLASGTQGIALGSSTASGSSSFAAGGGGQNTASGVGAMSIVAYNTSSGTYSVAIGYGCTSNNTNTVAIGRDAIASDGQRAVSLGKSRASGTDSFAAAVATNSSSYGATGANSIAMGYQAKASVQGAVAIGYTAVAENNTHAVAIGRSYADGADSFAAAIGNSASSLGAKGDQSVAIGYYATANGGNHSLALGGNTSVTASYATAINGGNTGNEATQQGAFAFGRGAKAAIVGKFAFANDRFSSNGDAQGGMYILRADTTDATATVLTTDNSTAGSTDQIVAASDTCITFDGTITAMQNGAQAYASWRIEGLLVNDGGTTTLANSATTVIDNQSDWVMALSADNTNNALAITCTGEASHNIRWVANIRTTEVTYA